MGERALSDGSGADAANTELAPEIVAILRSQEMRGEQTVNHVRVSFGVLGLAMALLASEINTPEANQLYYLLPCLMVGYSLVLYTLFRGTLKGRYVPALKYVSITFDLLVIHLGVFPASFNHAGVLEYFQSFIPLTLVLFNLLSGLRYSVIASLYSGVVCIIMSAAVLAVTVSNGMVQTSEVAVYGQPMINVSDEVLRIVFVALPAFVVAVVARISRDLVLRAEHESMNRAHTEKQRDRLSKYLSPELAEVVLANPDKFELGGTKRLATVLFSDIRNFTPFTERNEPEAVVSLLNQYFQVMVPIVFRYGGTLDKFLGDGLMAVFGVPFELEEAELRAVMVAIDMVEASRALNRSATPDQVELAQLSMGVGVATGQVVSGNIGSLERMEYTCIGDPVNYAARLEDLNRGLGTHILLSETAAEAVGEHIVLRRMMPIKVKGKRGESRVFALHLEDQDEAALGALRRRLTRSEPVF